MIFLAREKFKIGRKCKNPDKILIIFLYIFFHIPSEKLYYIVKAFDNTKNTFARTKKITRYSGDCCAINARINDTTRVKPLREFRGLLFIQVNGRRI